MQNIQFGYDLSEKYLLKLFNNLSVKWLWFTIDILGFLQILKICIPYMCFTGLAAVQDGSSDVQWFVSEGNIYLSC